MAHRHLSTRPTRSSFVDQDRQSRTSRMYRARYSRSPQRPSLKLDDDFFVIRKSMADYEREELNNLEHGSYYQRIHILAKNIPLPEPPPPPEPAPMAQPSGVIAPITVSRITMGTSSRHRATSLAKLNRASSSAMQPKEEEVPPDFKKVFEMKFVENIQRCNDASFTEDKLGGLFICMGDYSYLLVEGTEEMVTYFMFELEKFVPPFWSNNRVFAVEDKITETHFEGKVVCLRAAAININEKFPPSTPTDDNLMAPHHFKILEKVTSICSLLSEEELVEDMEELPSTPYNKLLPEIQRIDLVLSCTRFYRKLDQFMTLYKQQPANNEDEWLTWPLSFNYTPSNVFQRSPFDINLTFANYGQPDADKKERSSERERYSTKSQQEDV